LGLFLHQIPVTPNYAITLILTSLGACCLESQPKLGFGGFRRVAKNLKFPVSIINQNSVVEFKLGE
jgi:hypothetical protein